MLIRCFRSSENGNRKLYNMTAIWASSFIFYLFCIRFKTHSFIEIFLFSFFVENVFFSFPLAIRNIFTFSQNSCSIKNHARACSLEQAKVYLIAWFTWYFDYVLFDTQFANDFVEIFYLNFEGYTPPPLGLVS